MSGTHFGKTSSVTPIADARFAYGRLPSRARRRLADRYDAREARAEAREQVRADLLKQEAVDTLAALRQARDAAAARDDDATYRRVSAATVSANTRYGVSSSTVIA